MPTINLCMQIHQPLVLRRYSVFDTDDQYFDGYRCRENCTKLASRCVLPANRVILSLVRNFGGRFRLSYRISGAAIDLFERFCPDVIESFRKLADTGCVEFLAMPYNNGLSFLYSPREFVAQVELHRERIEDLFGTRPKSFWNTEFIHGDDLAEGLAQMGFEAIVCDSAVEPLAGRSCNRVYTAPRCKRQPARLLLRNRPLSCDTWHGFGDRRWDAEPLTAPGFAEMVGNEYGGDDVVTICWNYATFGLRHGPDTGVLDFLRYLPEKILSRGGLDFATCSDVVDRYAPAGEYRVGRYVSNTEAGGNLSAWLGNSMQSHAMHRLFEFEKPVRDSGDERLVEDWRNLQGAEYYYAMSTRHFENPVGDLPFARLDSPYDAYINFMNICDNLASRVEIEPGVYTGQPR